MITGVDLDIQADARENPGTQSVQLTSLKCCIHACDDIPKHTEFISEAKELSTNIKTLVKADTVSHVLHHFIAGVQFIIQKYTDNKQ